MVEAINALGSYQNHINPLKQETVDAISEHQATCQVSFERNAGGQVLNQRAHNCEGREIYALHYVQHHGLTGVAEYKQGAFARAVRESGVTHLKFIWAEGGPEAGSTKEVLYFDRDGTPQPDRDGTYGVQHVFDQNGRVVEAIALGADRQPTVNTVGIAKEVRASDDLGNRTRETYLGRDGQRVLGQLGVAEA